MSNAYAALRQIYLIKEHPILEKNTINDYLVSNHDK